MFPFREEVSSEWTQYPFTLFPVENVLFEKLLLPILLMNVGEILS
jgi:hypothetical protein